MERAEIGMKGRNSTASNPIQPMPFAFTCPGVEVGVEGDEGPGLGGVLADEDADAPVPVLLHILAVLHRDALREREGQVADLAEALVPHDALEIGGVEVDLVVGRAVHAIDARGPSHVCLRGGTVPPGVVEAPSNA